MRWPMMLSFKGSSGTCIPDGRVTFLLAACTAHQGVVPADDCCQARILCGDAITTHADLLRGGWREAVPWVGVGGLCGAGALGTVRDRVAVPGVARGCRATAVHRSVWPPRAASRAGPPGAGA